MKFHPVISIILGFIVYEIVYQIAVHAFGIGLGIGTILFYFALILGGFVATYFAEQKKIKYGIYEGIRIAIAVLVATLSFSESISARIILLIVTIIVFAWFGGAVAKRLTRNSQKNQEKIV